MGLNHMPLSQIQVLKQKQLVVHLISNGTLGFSSKPPSFWSKHYLGPSKASWGGRRRPLVFSLGQPNLLHVAAPLLNHSHVPPFIHISDHRGHRFQALVFLQLGSLSCCWTLSWVFPRALWRSRETVWVPDALGAQFCVEILSVPLLCKRGDS